jgi:isopenicillin-N epimerase
VLWTAPARQSQTFPAILSHGTDMGYLEAFDWVGTRDVTPWLCFAAGARAHDSFGGASLMDRNRSLAAEGAGILIQALGGEISAPTPMRAAMAAIRIDESPTEPQTAAQLRRALAYNFGIGVPVHAFGGNLWLRISAQIYNEIDDYRRCEKAFLAARESLKSHI